MTEKKQSLAEEILLFVKDMSDIFYDGLLKSVKIHSHFPNANQHTITCTINRLKKEDLLEETEVDEKQILRLTQKGRLKIFKSYVNKKPRWDGKWRIVIFDIPEDKKKLREIFRVKLKEIGFRRLQNSVWITPQDVQTAIKMLAEGYLVAEYTQFVLAEAISGEQKLIKEFDLTT